MNARLRRMWPWLRRTGAWLFLGLVAVLLVRQARTVDWPSVLRALHDIPRPALLAALAVSAASFALYSTFDLLGRRMTRHRLGAGAVMGVTFVSYAFNLNLGTLVGGVAFRYRLYARLGLDTPTITRVVGFSMLTNWLGYAAVAGSAFLLWPMPLPPEWRIGPTALRGLGGAALALAIAYLLLCGFARGRVWHVRGHALETPGAAMAWLQLLLSCANWSLMGCVIWLLLQQQLPYPQVLAVLLVAALAGVLTHVPAGLGVLETVFVALLSHRLPADRLLGALLAYRAVYYLAPLAVALVGYAAMEMRARRLRVAT